MPNPTLELYSKVKNMGMSPVSFSQLSLYHQCNKRWKLNYIDKLKIPNYNMHLTFGTAMHNTIQKWIEIMYNESAKKANLLDLEKELKEQINSEYKLALNESKKHYSTAKEISEFYNDGINILKFLKSKRNDYFKLRNWKLIGCEVPFISSIDSNPKVALYGFIDLILKDTFNETYQISDIKTSTGGWGSYQKDDPLKRAQVLIYKHYYSKQNNIDVNNIDVDFFILKRKLKENCEWPQKRIQIFKPPSGKPSINKTIKLVDEFVLNCFDKDGNHKTDKTYHKTGNFNNCKFCEYANSKYCDIKIK